MANADAGADQILTEEEQAMVPLGASATSVADQELDALSRSGDEKGEEAGQPAPSTGIHEWQAFVNAFKSFVGVGILALPYALAQSGLLAGVLSLVLIAFASSYTIKQVVRCKNELMVADRVRALARCLFVCYRLGN